ncbi:hypothetical protein V5O48_000214 [Marasmius crinis-equi]|uniref:Peptide hydrolase n=1 Tax=Marasmius crinis-equi TaxID=585013 RepID=A0ABR3G2C6_9AGAR
MKLLTLFLAIATSVASFDQQQVFTLETPRLIQLGKTLPPVWMTEREKNDLRLKARATGPGITFMDITDTQDLGSRTHTRVRSPYHSPNASDQVKSVIKKLSTEGPRANLEKFTSFHTRYYRSESGKQSQKWLLSRINETTTSTASPTLLKRITIREFPHPWGQNSIIARINGSVNPDEIVIIGAHQDSQNYANPDLAAPGADDDGSGSITILESYRALLSADFSPERTVEFHWYAAEEVGLLGSQAVAADYERRGQDVVAMSQFDMVAWVKRGTKEVIGIITDEDWTDEGCVVDVEFPPTLAPDRRVLIARPPRSLSNFNKKLVEAYLDIPWVDTKCNQICSDHSSWTKAGYPSSFNFESIYEDYNPHVHGVEDRTDISDEFSFDHMLEFSKLAVAFAVELGLGGGEDVE